MQGPFHSLRLENIRLQVRLGCSAAERASAQEVRLNVEFRFLQAPRGIESDRLEETICYADVCAALENHCHGKEFQLIERVGFEAYQIARRFAGPNAQVSVEAHKVRPPVDNLTGGAFYRCGDFVG